MLISFFIQIEQVIDSIMTPLLFSAWSLVAVISFFRSTTLSRQWRDSIANGIKLQFTVSDLSQSWVARTFQRSLAYRNAGIISLFYVITLIGTTIGMRVEPTLMNLLITDFMRLAGGVGMVYGAIKYATIPSYGVKAELKALKKLFPHMPFKYHELKEAWDADKVINFDHIQATIDCDGDETDTK